MCMDTVVLLISFLMQGFANDHGRDLCKANTAPGSLGKGEKFKSCCVDIISPHSRSVLEVTAILSVSGMFWFFCLILVFLLQMVLHHLHTWTLSVHSTYTFNSPPNILMNKIILWWGHQPSNQRLQVVEDLRPPSDTGKCWLYSLDAKSDTNLSLLLGKGVVHICFQLCAFFKHSV